MIKKKRLGKGLSALLNEDFSDLDLKQELSGKNLISVNKISLSKFQARRKFDVEKLEELSQSIAKNGLIQPIIIRKVKKDFDDSSVAITEKEIEERLKQCYDKAIAEISS